MSRGEGPMWRRVKSTAGDAVTETTGSTAVDIIRQNPLLDDIEICPTCLVCLRVLSRRRVVVAHNFFPDTNAAHIRRSFCLRDSWGGCSFGDGCFGVRPLPPGPRVAEQKGNADGNGGSTGPSGPSGTCRSACDCFVKSILRRRGRDPATTGSPLGTTGNGSPRRQLGKGKLLEGRGPRCQYDRGRLPGLASDHRCLSQFHKFLIDLAEIETDKRTILSWR